MITLWVKVRFFSVFMHIVMIIEQSHTRVSTTMDLLKHLVWMHRSANGSTARYRGLSGYHRRWWNWTPSSVFSYCHRQRKLHEKAVSDSEILMRLLHFQLQQRSSVFMQCVFLPYIEGLMSVIKSQTFSIYLIMLLLLHTSFFKISENNISIKR